MSMHFRFLSRIFDPKTGTRSPKMRFEIRKATPSPIGIAGGEPRRRRRFAKFSANPVSRISAKLAKARALPKFLVSVARLSLFPSNLALFETGQMEQIVFNEPNFRFPFHRSHFEMQLSQE